MKVYLDTSVLNRLFDDQSRVRIYLESTAVLVIFMLIENRVIDVISSDVLLFENAKNPYTERRTFVGRVLQNAKISQPINKKIMRKSQEIEAFGISGIDAMHLSCAEEARADCFITCDDKISKRYKGKMKVRNPTEFIIDLLKEEE